MRLQLVELIIASIDNSNHAALFKVKPRVHKCEHLAQRVLELRLLQQRRHLHDGREALDEAFEAGEWRRAAAGGQLCCQVEWVANLCRA